MVIVQDSCLVVSDSYLSGDNSCLEVEDRGTSRGMGVGSVGRVAHGRRADSMEPSEPLG